MPVFKEFRIGDVLRRIDVAKLSGRIGEMPKEPCVGYDLPAVASGSLNQGVACYVSREGATILKGVISVASNGDGYAFYQPAEFTIIQDAYAVERKDGVAMSEGQALYLVAGLQKLLDQLFGWTNKSGWVKVKECFLSLPAKIVTRPDWNKLQSVLTCLGGGYHYARH